MICPFQLFGSEPLDVHISDDYFNKKLSNPLSLDIGQFQFTIKVLDKCLSKHTKNNSKLLWTNLMSDPQNTKNNSNLLWRYLIIVC